MLLSAIWFKTSFILPKLVVSKLGDLPLGVHIHRRFILECGEKDDKLTGSMRLCVGKRVREGDWRDDSGLSMLFLPGTHARQII